MKQQLYFFVFALVLGVGPAARAQNLLSKPDYGQTGNAASATTDFTTGYTAATTAAALTYALVADASTFSTGVTLKTDHTLAASPGLLLAVKGPSTAAGTSTTVWQKTVAGLSLNTSYTFSYWQRNLSATNPANIRLAANGTTVANSQLATSNTAWTLVSYTLNTGLSNTLTLTLTDQTVATNGNLFGLDDMALYLANAGSLGGTVFEDVNYGGGIGRTLSTATSSAASSGLTITRPLAKVELYGSAPTNLLLASTTTDGSGTYVFPGVVAGSYQVRVVTSTVTSSRTGYVSGLLPVATVVASATDQVGGPTPATADGGANNGVQQLGDLTPAAAGPATVSGTNATTGVDFGFNFDLVVNTNDSGQGSLRQFMLNANALGNETVLAQAGSYYNQTVGANPLTPTLPAKTESSIFMIADGQAHDGLRANSKGGPANQLNAAKVAEITPANNSPLPTLTSPATAINGWTQTFNIGNTNGAVLGAGGTVGSSTTILPQLGGPEVQLTGSTNVALGLYLNGASEQVIGLCVYGFGNALANDDNTEIRLSAATPTVTGCVLGTPATSFAKPATLTNADGLRITAGSGAVVSYSLLGFHKGRGIFIGVNAPSVTVNFCEVRGNGQANASYDGVDAEGNASTITNSLIANNPAQGIDSYLSAGNHTWTGNTVTGNGVGTADLSPAETAGIRVFGTNNLIKQNLVTYNYGAGIMLTSGTFGSAPVVTRTVTNTIISQNAVYGNGAVAAAKAATGARPGQIGIDLHALGDNAEMGKPSFVTTNNSASTGANSLIPYPVLRSARLNGNSLVLEGYAAAGITLELFLATPNTLTASQFGYHTKGNNFGQGSQYLYTDVVAKSGITGSYAATDSINGVGQGSATGINQFTLIVPLGRLTPTQVNALKTGTALLTSTATLAGTGTSEFSGNVLVTSGVTTYDVLNQNVGQNTTAVALNPSLTVPLAAYDPINTVTSFTVFPAANGTLYYNGTAVASTGTKVLVAKTNLLTFTPTTGFYGDNATFQFYATSTSSSGTTQNSQTPYSVYSIPVVYTNKFVANDDQLDAPKNAGSPVTKTTGNVALNDTNPDNTTDYQVTLQVTLGGTTTTSTTTLATAHGSVTLNGALGSYTYTPTAGYLGPDSFQYTIYQSGATPTNSNVATVSINVFDPATVCLTANGPNQLANPGFESGNDGSFTSSYKFVSIGNGDLYPEGNYAVDTDAHAYHNSFQGKGRGGAGKFMIVNGSNSLSKVYSQVVQVLPNRYYSYSGWANSVNPGSPAILGFVINGKSASSSTQLGTTTDYTQFSGIWYSGNSRTATFEVRDINRDAGGNDFGLDDLSFQTCSVNLYAVDVNNASVANNAPATAISAMQGVVSGPGAQVASFTIKSLPKGTLRLGGPSGAVVTLGQVILLADASTLYFTPLAGFTGNDTFTYTATDTEQGGSVNVANFTIPVTAAPLPVELATFTARNAGSAAQLDWVTASEHNSAYFAVERSLSGQAGSFVAIGRVAAQGTLVRATSYRFVDRNAAAQGQLVYYRLRQVDIDGRFALSPVRAVAFAAASLALYPNPTLGTTTLDLHALPATATYQVRVLDATGRVAATWELAGGQAQPLDVAALASGTYLVLVTGLQADGSSLRQVLHLSKE